MIAKSVVCFTQRKPPGSFDLPNSMGLVEGQSCKMSLEILIDGFLLWTNLWKQFTLNLSENDSLSSTNYNGIVLCIDSAKMSFGLGCVK